MSDDLEVLWALLEYIDECEEEVTRHGHPEPCEKPAVALRKHPEGIYPVCAYHSCREMVPLAEVVRAAQESAS